MVTFGIDPRDYATMAARLAESALRNERLAAARGALVIGPVDTDACAYPFDQVTLQEKIQAALHQAGRLDVAFAVNALPEPSAQAALIRLNQFNFEKNAAEAGAELRALAATANIDFLLFGRLSARETLVAGVVEVTYVFNWKLGDCRSGLLVWNEDFDLTKRGPAAGAPVWFELGKSDTTTARFAVGSAVGADPVRNTAAARQGALKQLADRTNRTELADPEIMRPITPDEYASVSEVVVTRSGGGGGPVWLMLRVPQMAAAARMAARTSAYGRWRTVRDAVDDMVRLPQAQRRPKLLALRRTLAGFEAEFPPTAENFINVEAFALKVAELELMLGDPWAARQRLERLSKQANPGPWSQRAAHQLAALPAGSGDLETHLLRRELEGRRVRLWCAWSADGTNRVWKRATAELQRWLEQSDAMVQVEMPPATGDLRAVAEAARPAAGDDRDFVFHVRGELRQRPDPREPLRRNDAFEGDVWSAFHHAGRWIHPVSAHVATGWTIFGPELTLDVLALEAVKQWRRGLVEALARAPGESL